MSSVATPTATATWAIDATHSNAEFAVKHMMVSTVKGRFATLDGAIAFDEAAPHAAAVSATLDVASIFTGDPNRDGHLRSADFFDAERFPSITFRSTRVEPLDEGRAKVHGLLTIRDVTKDVVLDTEYEGQVTDAYGKRRAAFTAEAAIARKDFGLTWNPLLESGGAVVGDRVRITLHIAAVLQEQE